jgi:hypothetical protein
MNCVRFALTAAALIAGFTTPGFAKDSADELATKLSNPIASLISVGAGTRYWAASPEGRPDGFGVRGVVTLLFPK